MNEGVRERMPAGKRIEDFLVREGLLEEIRSLHTSAELESERSKLWSRVEVFLRQSGITDSSAVRPEFQALVTRIWNSRPEKEDDVLH